MNLHEECLLKYLLNPIGLGYSTELLKQANEFLEQGIFKADVLANAVNLKYTADRV